MPAGEERVLHEPARVLGLHAAVGQQDVDAGVVRDDRVERARVLVGVELEQDFLHDSSSGRARREADAFAARLVEGQVAPVERGLLPVVLAQPAGDRRLHELLPQVEGVRVLVDAELVEDLVDVGALDEALGVERVDPVGVREDADVGVGDARVQLAQLGLGVGPDVLVLDRQQPAVDVLGQRALLLREVHELGGQDGLADRAPRPVDDLGGQHVADPELLAEADQQRVDAGRVGLGELGQVADAHEHLGVRVAAAHLEVAPEARGEAGADRLDDRVDEERLAELAQVGDGRVEAVEVVGRVRDQHRRRAQLRRHVPVLPVEAEHVVHARRVGHQDLVGVERVDAEREAAGLEARRSPPAPRRASCGRATGRGRSRRRRRRGSSSPRSTIRSRSRCGTLLISAKTRMSRAP